MATFTEADRTALTDALGRLLGDHGTEADVRRVMETPEGYDPALWRRLAEMGVVGLLVDEDHGGAGGGPVEVERVMEEAGAALLCGPLLSSGVLAASLLGALDDEDAKDRLLPGIADGSRIATVAFTGDVGGWTRESVDVQARRDKANWSLDGAASFVTHAQIARTLLVAARWDGDIAVFEVDADTPGLTISPLPAFDYTLRLARLTFQATPARAVMAGRPAWGAIERMMEVALVALAGEQAGGARRVLEMTVDYARTRIQFGRAIGSFQAIKHMAADLLLESESATSAARHAARSLADGAMDAGAAVSLAAFACADAFTAVTAASIQMHGGIAFTWVHPAHLYLRRARADAQLFGGPSFHRERYLQQLGA
jgi:alkylation response protein AidB-like acyl-CoA dehydrogenase